jgi:hypothetical protein
MYQLTSDTLTVSILDPAADQERFGTRYCTGGYIYQVTDSRHGELLSGPTYPDSFNWFDGQGIPDAFNLSPLREPASEDGTALIVGVGRCDLRANRVLEFCSWEVREAPQAIRMVTEQRFQGFALELERGVELRERTLRSAAWLRNTGRNIIPVRWFPHPFFPQPEGDELCRVNFPVRLPEDASYTVAESGFIARTGWPWDDGRFQPLGHDARSNLVVLQKHPSLGLVAATCSYIPSFFPIWGNPRTFSWEPYLERTVAPGEELAWSIDYDF